MSSQLSYFALTNKVPDGYSLYGFYQNIGPVIVEPRVPLFHCFEMYNFDGHIISTDIGTTQQLLKTFSAKQKIFYIWDLEWIRKRGTYEFYRSVYCNPELTLVTRGTEYARLVEDCWNVKCHVVENVNYEEFVDRVFV